MTDTVGLWIGTYIAGLQTGYKAFVGSEQIWPVPAWAQWGATSVYGTIINGDTVKATVAGDATQAAFSLGDKPLVGKVYFEGEACSGFDVDSGTTGIGLATYVSGAIPTNGIGTLDTQLDMGSNSFRAALYSAFTQIGPDLTPHNTGTTYIYRFGFAYDATTRKCWVRQVYPGGPGPWILGGDPVAGTTPSYTMPGTDPVYIAGSVRGDTHGDASQSYMKIIANPAQFLNAGVSGYGAVEEGFRTSIANGLANGATGDSITGSYTTPGMSGSLTWRRDGTTPPGVTFTGAARSGSYTTAGTYTWYTTVKDSNNRLAQIRESVTVISGVMALTGTLTNVASRGVPYSSTLTLSGAFTGPVTMDTSVGSIPAGLSWSVSGNTVTLSGTPTTNGAVSFTPRATDSSGTPKVATTGSQTITTSAATITVAGGISTGTRGQPNTGSYTATGGTGPYTYAVTAGTLPTGMTVSSAGARGGTDTATGTFNYTITATDSFGNTGTLAQTVVVSAATIVMGGSISSGTTGSSASGSYTATGGFGTYTFSVNSGSLPGSMTVNTSGVRGGVYSPAGTYTYNVNVTDSFGNTGDLPQTLVVSAISVGNPNTTPVYIGDTFSGTYSATGGTAPYTFSTTTGTVPPGFAMSSAGVRSGTSTTRGTYTWNTHAVDSASLAGDLSNTLKVFANISIAGSISTGNVSTPWSGSYVASGGTGPYTYAVFTGTLPSGMSVSSSGVRSGTPTATGTSSFTIRATDANGDYRDLPQTVVVSAAVTGPSVRSTATNASTAGGTGSWSVPMPAGAAVGDVVLVCCHLNDFSGTLGAPTGWTNVGILNSTYDAGQFGLFWKKLDGSEGSTITGTASSASYADWAAEAICVTGTTAGTVTTATSISGSGSTGVRTFTFPTVTTTNANTLMVIFEGLDVNARGVTAPTWTAPSGYTTQPQVNSFGNVAQVIGFTFLKSTAGAETPTNTATPGGSSGGAQIGWLIGVNP